jgi:hypothetical protein
MLNNFFQIGILSSLLPSSPDFGFSNGCTELSVCESGAQNDVV